MRHALLLLLLCNCTFIFAQKPETIVLFGDSLSDDGNIFEISQFRFPPSPPHFEGRFSDGPVWIEHVKQHFKVEPENYLNYAHAGARTGFNTSFPFIPYGLLDQLEEFRPEAEPRFFGEHSWFVVLGGGNDYIQSAETYDPDVVISTLLNLETIVRELHALGARNFMVPNLPDFGTVPLYNDFPSLGMNVSAYTSLHNILHNELLESLSVELDVVFWPLDLEAGFDEILSNPSQFGLEVVDESCLIVTDPSEENYTFELCPDASVYLFFDYLHPTARGHELIAEFAISSFDESFPSTSTGNAWIFF